MQKENGIMLRIKDEAVEKAKKRFNAMTGGVCEDFKYLCTPDGYSDLSITYWRECNGIRKEILNAISDITPDDGWYKLTVTALDKIITIVRKFTKEHYCKENLDGPLWNIEDVIGWNEQYVHGLSWVKEYLITHGGSVALFYDLDRNEN